LVAFLAASASIAPLFNAFGANDGGFDNDAHFLVVGAALGAPGTKTVVATIFFHHRSSVQIYRRCLGHSLGAGGAYINDIGSVDYDVIDGSLCQ
jgi:hypothetical protein